MAPIGEGFFLDLRTGECIPIHEHRHAVQANPVRYRVTPGEIADKCRDGILKLVLSFGFVRVRADREWVVAEFDAPLDEALPIIRGFLAEHGFIGHRRVRIRDHRRRRQLECTADAFLSEQTSPEDWNKMRMTASSESRGRKGQK